MGEGEEKPLLHFLCHERPVRGHCLCTIRCDGEACVPQHLQDLDSGVDDVPPYFILTPATITLSEAKGLVHSRDSSPAAQNDNAVTFAFAETPGSPRAIVLVALARNNDRQVPAA